MPISLNEIRSRALQFSKEWKNANNEKAEAQTFWNEFFEVFGITRRRVASFEVPATKTDGQGGFIDMLWKGNCLIEHKSRGKDLDMACRQAFDYFPGIKEAELPKYVIVSDFARFRVHNLDEDTHIEFLLEDLTQNIHHFGFISGYQKTTYKEEDPVNIEAALRMGKLHDQLKAIGYEGHHLEVYLVRLLFCLFADDTGIFEKDCFQQYIEQRTSEDGSDLANQLAGLFQVLNTPKEKLLKTLDESLAQFPYVNGKLFDEALPIAAFNKDMRQLLIECCYLDWGKISPAIFGSLFQSVMDPEKRRNIGGHYTSEKNILKLIKPLFLDELWEEFESIKSNPNKLKEFHKKLSTLKFLDPACGCGNFLVIAYRELRLLEIQILRGLIGKEEKLLKIDMQVLIDVDQFYGIEIEEFPVRIAEVALWLIDHQMNMLISEEFGQYFVRLPLKKSPNIINCNALRIDWKELIKPENLSYILGNPPFGGARVMDKIQKSDMVETLSNIEGVSNLDYVCAWYYKAALYIQDNNNIKVAFVSTNSITQGEQVVILWKNLFNSFRIKIDFAHRTFKWTNEARGQAAVFVVIIGFSKIDVKNKIIWDYETPTSEAHEISAKNINPYLVDAADIFIVSRSKPLCNVPEISFGNMPNEGGHFLLDDDEKQKLVSDFPCSAKFIKPLLSADQFINGENRWCIWLLDSEPAEINQCAGVKTRINLVKQMRENSKRKATRKLSETPSLFGEIRQPRKNYILIPRHSSERRKYVPMGFFSPNFIVSDSCLAIDDAKLYHFGILTSEMHMSWMKSVCGRIKSDFRYSNTVVYNNFPWPKNPGEKNTKAVEENAQQVLDVRAKFPESSLADLYDPLTMPAELVNAHEELDKSVDLCYRPQPFTTEANRIEYLFALYNEYTAPLTAKKKKKTSK
jgi:hypothetical protein